MCLYNSGGAGGVLLADGTSDSLSVRLVIGSGQAPCISQHTHWLVSLNSHSFGFLDFLSVNVHLNLNFWRIEFEEFVLLFY